MDDKSLHLHLVPLDRIAVAWPTARRWIISAAQDAGEYSDGDIVGRLYSCDFTLFIAYDNNQPFGAFTAEVAYYPKGPVVYIVHLGSDNLDKMAKLLGSWEHWVRSRGAEKIRIIGRLGLERRLPEFGFVKKFICMEKELWVAAQNRPLVDRPLICNPISKVT